MCRGSRAILFVEPTDLLTRALEDLQESVTGLVGAQNPGDAPGLVVVARLLEDGIEHLHRDRFHGAARVKKSHFDNKARVEAKVRQLGFPSFVILRPVFFMENLAGPWFKPYIDQGNLAVGIKPGTKLQMISVADIGKYGKLAFEKHAELNGKALDIAGDELTMPQTAALIAKAAGKPVTHFQVPIEDVRKGSEDFALMLEWFDAVGYDADIAVNAKAYGIRPTPFAEWVQTVKW